MNSSLKTAGPSAFEEAEDQMKEMLEQVKTYGDSHKKLDFPPAPLVLKFQSGAQKDSIWKISFLPRSVGAKDCDLPLLDPLAPDKAFEIFFKQGEIYFQTSHQQKILFNYTRTRQAPLKKGDLIIVGFTYIQVIS